MGSGQCVHHTSPPKSLHDMASPSLHILRLQINMIPSGILFLSHPFTQLKVTHPLGLTQGASAPIDFPAESSSPPKSPLPALLHSQHPPKPGLSIPLDSSCPIPSQSPCSPSYFPPYPTFHLQIPPILLGPSARCLFHADLLNPCSYSSYLPPSCPPGKCPLNCSYFSEGLSYWQVPWEPIPCLILLCSPRHCHKRLSHCRPQQVGGG